jgi:hypothetical protein
MGLDPVSVREAERLAGLEAVMNEAGGLSAGALSP